MSFVHLGGVFCAHVTGNIVVLVSDVAQLHECRWLSVATIPVFMLAVALVHRLARSRSAGPKEPSDPKAQASRTLLTVLAFEGAFIAFAALLGIVADSGHSPAIQAVVVLSLVVAMAAQSALHRLHPELGPCSTVMTGNLAQWMLLRSDPSANRSAAPRSNPFGPVIAMFVVGCVSGVATTRLLGLSVLLLPVCVLYASALRLLHTPRPDASQVSLPQSGPLSTSPR